MPAHVLFERKGVSTWETTLWAPVWLFPGVNAEVFFQSSYLSERPPTLFTEMRLFSTVGEQMLCKIIWLDCGVVAQFALISFLWEMCFDVISKIVCSWKRIMALCALVRLLPTVGALVPLQGSSHTKWTSAFWAFVFFLSSMGDHVFFQGGGVSKWLPTFCNCVFSFYSGWAYVLLDQTTSRILNKCGSLIHCGWACVFWEPQLDQTISDIGYNCMPFLWCGLPCASSDLLIDQMTFGILNKCEFCLHLRWGNDSSFQFALAWNTQNPGVCQAERSETVQCHCQCKGFCHFYFSIFMVNFQLSNYFWHFIVFPLKAKTMREWTILNINIEVLARARETHFIHFFGILSAFSQFQEKQNVTHKKQTQLQKLLIFRDKGTPNWPSWGSGDFRNSRGGPNSPPWLKNRDVTRTGSQLTF